MRRCGKSAGLSTTSSAAIRIAQGRMLTRLVRRSNIAGNLMSNSRTFSGVNADALSRIKGFGRAEYSVVFDPPEGPRSTATSQTPFGECVVEFVHDSARSELTLTIVKKPWLVPEGLLWGGFVAALERCREQAVDPAAPVDRPSDEG